MKAVSLTARAWAEADSLFHADPRWLGSDDAYTVPLGGDRTLWLFGDTFVSPEGRPGRADSIFVNNTIGIQRGLDPSTARIEFHWDGGRTPRSFFAPPAGDGTWYWPLHGIRLGNGALMVFFMVVRPSVRGVPNPIELWRLLGALSFFEVVGWEAIFVPDPDLPPTEWARARAARPVQDEFMVVGSAVVAHGEFLLAYAWDRSRRLRLCRWPMESVLRAELSRPEWWCGDAAGWQYAGTPQIVIERGATEFSVHESGGLWWQVQMDGLIGASIAVRRAERPQGPWSEPDRVFDPPEATRDDVLVYAAKAHPELSGAPIVATYASNAAVDVTLRDDSLYYPQFVRIGDA